MGKIAKTADSSLKNRYKDTFARDFKKNGVLYLLILPVIIYFFIFNYIPMFGILVAFQDHNPLKGVFGSRWVGLQNFIDLFTSTDFMLALRNTVCMGVINLVIGFFTPVIFALLLSQVRFKRLKRGVQLVSYLPNFASTMVIVTLATQFLSYNGVITNFLAKFGLVAENGWFQENSPAFWLINCLISVWQGFGWGSIVFVAGIGNINPDLYEAASLDGADRWGKLWHITLPGIRNLILMLLTVNIGTMFLAGFDKIILLYNEHIYEFADCISSYTYRLAFANGIPNYGLSTAAGLLQSVVGTVMLIGSNLLSRKVSDMSLF